MTRLWLYEPPDGFMLQVWTLLLMVLIMVTTTHQIPWMLTQFNTTKLSIWKKYMSSLQHYLASQYNLYTWDHWIAQIRYIEGVHMLLASSHSIRIWLDRCCQKLIEFASNGLDLWWQWSLIIISGNYLVICKYIPITFNFLQCLFLTWDNVCDASR